MLLDSENALCTAKSVKFLHRNRANKKYERFISRLGRAAVVGGELVSQKYAEQAGSRITPALQLESEVRIFTS